MKKTVSVQERGIVAPIDEWEVTGWRDESVDGNYV